jgi:hypothetical protein
MAVTGLPERASMVQREMSDTVSRMRPEYARTLATFQKNTRKKTGRMAGLQVPYWRDHAHGQTWYSPVANATSFKKSIKQNSGAMYIGVAYRNMDIWLEAHILADMERGFIPDSYIKERRRRISTHMMKKNWAAIGDGTGSIAIVASAAGTTVTAKADNSARGSSKGVFRLKITDSTDQLLYDAINASGAVVATFYVTAKPTSTTATVVFTVGNAAAMNTAGFKIVESGSYNLEMMGIAGLISDSTTRIFQDADVSVDPFLVNQAVDAGNAVVTPTTIHSAKGVMLTRGNAPEDSFPFIGHISWVNYRDLAKFGYASRQYTLNDNSKGTKTYGVPNVYEDGDTVWVPDSDYEDCYIDLRERAPFFEYVQKEFGLKTVGGVSRHEWIGSNQVGSTNEYENYNEACNLGWDGRGVDGEDSGGNGGGSPNSSVFIKNIALSTSAQYAVGV